MTGAGPSETSGTVNVVLAGPTPPPPALDAIVARLGALDPRCRVVVELYEEPHALRSARSTGRAEDLRHLAPSLTGAQRTALAEAEVVLALDLPFRVAEVAPRLRWVHGLGVGTGQLQNAGVFDAGITLTNSAGASAAGIAEFVIARLLQHVKELRELDIRQREQRWEPLHGGTLAGATLVLVGLGAINRAVAARAAAFDMVVLACHRTARPGEAAPAHVAEVVGPWGLTAMLRRADVVVFAVPETPETVGMVDRAMLEGLRRGTVVCNVGRGSLIDEVALVELLHAGHIGAAVLDVSSREPMPEGDPLWTAPNLYYSPHCSVVIEQLFANAYRLFEENLGRYLAGEPLDGVVSPEDRY